MSFIINLSKPREYTTLRTTPNVTYGLWVAMICQHRVIYCNECTNVAGDVNSGGGCARLGQRILETLYLLNFMVNAKLSSNIKSIIKKTDTHTNLIFEKINTLRNKSRLISKRHAGCGSDIGKTESSSSCVKISNDIKQWYCVKQQLRAYCSVLYLNSLSIKFQYGMYRMYFLNITKLLIHWESKIYILFREIIFWKEKCHCSVAWSNETPKPP